MFKKKLCVFLCIFILFSVFAGCGGQTKSANSTSADMAAVGKAPTANSASGEAARQEAAVGSSKSTTSSAPAQAPKVDAGSTALVGTDVSGQTIASTILSQRKIIRNANVSIEVENFDKALGQIGTIINGIGIIQETSIKKDRRIIDSKEVLITRGMVIIRVYADKFEKVLNDVGGLGLMLDQAVKSDDVTDKFFDIEARLRVLRIEYDKIEEYLKSINDPDIIFKTQNRLSQIRQEIENLTGTLNKYKDLVDLSTITINLSEKGIGSAFQTIEKSYWQRLGDGFYGSIKGAVKFFGELLILIAKALPVIIALGILGVLGIFIYKKTNIKFRKKENKIDKDE